jgi:hypothetical protein
MGDIDGSPPGSEPGSTWRYEMVSPIANESAMRVAKVRNRRPEDAKSLAPAKAAK